MAEKQAANDAGEQVRSNSSGVIGTIASGMATAWNAVTKDGFLAAAWRQGIEEIATALKPFPDSISAEVPGSLWNPTQGEIAKARDVSNDSPPHPWPSEIAQENRNQPVNDNGRSNSNGMDGGNSM
jgi:hypothetical protein